MKLEVGKKYKTRRGHKAFVFSVSGHTQEAIGVIELKSDGRHLPAMWFIDGSFHWDKKESGNDIVAEWDDTPDPGEGWKLLEVDEVIKKGDEWFCDNGWITSLNYWANDGKQSPGLVYRRRVAPQYVPYTWEDREELRGRWYRQKEYPELERLVARLEISRNEIEINGWGAQKFLQDCEWLDGTPCGKVVK